MIFHLCIILNSQSHSWALTAKRKVAREVFAQGTAAPAGRRGTATATSGARRSCSGERLSKGAEALVDIWLQSPRKRNKTTCSIM